MNNYSKAYVEVLEIITYLCEDEQDKIPIKKIKFFMENRDKDYNFQYDENIPFDEQHILPETKVIFEELYNDYFSKEEPQDECEKKLEHKENVNIIRTDEAFHHDNMFKQDESNIADIKSETRIESPEDKAIDTNKNSVDSANSLIKVNENIFAKFIKKIKNFLKRNNKND